MRNRKPHARPTVGAGPATATLPSASGGGTGPMGPAGPAGADGVDGVDGAPGPPGPAPAGTGYVHVTASALDVPDINLTAPQLKGGTDPASTLVLRATSSGAPVPASAIIFQAGAPGQLEVARFQFDGAGSRLLLDDNAYLSWLHGDGSVIDALGVTGGALHRVQFYVPAQWGGGALATVANSATLQAQQLFAFTYLGKELGTICTFPADGILCLSDWNLTTFDRLQFGGGSNFFPALKRAGVGLEVRLADGSALTTLRALLDAGDLGSGLVPIARLPATMAPSAHHASHDTGGADAIAALSGAVITTGTVADARLSSNVELVTRKNAASGYAGLDGSSKLTGSQQVYGAGANTAAQGNDARLSDARTPTAHKTSHETGGADALAALSAAILTSGLLPDARLDTNIPRQTKGTWLPVLGGAGGESGQTYSVQVGYWIKTGDKVDVMFNVALSAKGTITGALQVKGMTHPVANLANHYPPANMSYWQGTAIGLVHLTAFGAPTATALSVYGATGAAAGLSAGDTTWVTNTTQMIGSFSYRTA